MDSIWQQLFELHRARLERLSDPEVFCWFTALVRQLLLEGHTVGPRDQLREALERRGCSATTAVRIVAAIEAACLVGDEPNAEDPEPSNPNRILPRERD